MHVPQDSGDITSSLIDLDVMGLSEVAMLGDSVLVSALRMIRAEIERPDEAMAGFSSSL